MRNGRIKENSTKRRVHFIRVCVGQFASRYDDVDFISCFEVKNKVERPRTTTGSFPWVGFVILQQFPSVPSCVELSHACIGDGQHCFYVLIPLWSQHGSDQVAPFVWWCENACRRQTDWAFQSYLKWRPDHSKHDDKRKATWVTHCYVQVTVTRSAWAADQLTAIVGAKGCCFCVTAHQSVRTEAGFVHIQKPPGLSSCHCLKLGEEVRGTQMLCKSPVG